MSIVQEVILWIRTMYHIIIMDKNQKNKNFILLILQRKHLTVLVGNSKTKCLMIDLMKK